MVCDKADSGLEINKHFPKAETVSLLFISAFSTMPAVEDKVNKISENSNDFSEGIWYVKMEQLYKNEREDTHRKKKGRRT